MLIEGSTCRLSLFYQSLGKYFPITTVQFFSVEDKKAPSSFFQTHSGISETLYLASDSKVLRFWWPAIIQASSFCIPNLIISIWNDKIFPNFKEKCDCLVVIMRTASFTKSALECLELELKGLILSLKEPGTTSWDRVSKGKYFVAGIVFLTWYILHGNTLRPVKNLRVHTSLI